MVADGKSLHEIAEIFHAERYPDGCNESWKAMCEACCSRVGNQAVPYMGR
jgi:hypothetical protein